MVATPFIRRGLSCNYNNVTISFLCSSMHLCSHLYLFSFGSFLLCFVLFFFALFVFLLNSLLFIYIIISCYNRNIRLNVLICFFVFQTGRKIGAYEILDNLHFHDLDGDDKPPVSTMRDRWSRRPVRHYFRGVMM